MSGTPSCRLAARGAGACLGFAIATGVLYSGAAGAQPVSPAETLLFETDHLAKMQPATLVYQFSKRSNLEAAFTDSVELEVTRSKGQVHATLHFLNGKRRRELPEIDDAHGNPVLLGFLEHDIAEMKRLTGGSVTYFRKRIRMALANGAQVTPQRITWQGKTVEGQAVRIQPYLDDPLHARFENYVRKTYTFVFSDGVPGGLYQVSTSLANAGLKAPGTVVARAAGQGAAAPTAPKPGVATPGAVTSASAKPGAAGSGKAESGAAVSAAGTPAAPGAAQPGALPGTPGAPVAPPIPAIDETLTLVKVAAPRR